MLCRNTGLLSLLFGGLVVLISFLDLGVYCFIGWLLRLVVGYFCVGALRGVVSCG